MNTVVETYQHIAKILSFRTPKTELEEALSSSQFDWDAIVIEGSRHLVLPALYCRLRAKALLHLLPTELQTYLEELTAINRNRNTAILKQVQQISKRLTAHRINHVFLKGSAFLAQNLYADQAERMVGDIDILIEESQLDQAFTLLKQNGYPKTHGFAYDNKGFRHLDRLISEDELAAIELHNALLRKPYRHLISVEEVLRTKTYDNGIPIPNTYYGALHQILAWQLNDNGFFYKTVHFKSFYDSLVLKVPKQHELIETLLNDDFGKAYLELAKYYFEDFSEITSTRRMLLYRKGHLNYLINPLYRKALKPIKKAYKFLTHRAQQLLFNASYRRHAVKKIFLMEK